MYKLNCKFAQINFAIIDLTENLTLFSITGFAGSVKITLTPKEKGLHVKIFNITSLTSGDFFKNPSNPTNWVPSIQRPNDTKEDIPQYSNIGQYYFLLIPYSDEVPKI